MKNFLFSIIFSLIVSFSFSQEKNADKMYAKLKYQSVELVNTLDDLLNLTDKQKSIFMKHFGQYTREIINVQQKFKDKIDQKKPSKSDKDLSKKSKEFTARQKIMMTVMKYAEVRDQQIVKILKPKQIKAYHNYMGMIHPITLEENGKKAKDLPFKKKKRNK